MADMARDELIAYFNEHVLYELLMLRYSRNLLRAHPLQLVWNVNFAAFNVSARNLYDYLNNKGGKNEVNVHAYLPYAKSFRISSISDITGTLQKINEQVFHMGRKRPTDKGKVTLDRIEIAFGWAESNMISLVASFEEEFRKKIQMERADPTTVPTVYTGGPTGPSGPTSTNIAGGFPARKPEKSD
jgi:hypothetical protein